MNVFLDHCVNALILTPLNNQFREDQVSFKTAIESGWEQLDNGKLLTNVEQSFDVFMTGDTSLPAQQELSEYQLGFIVVSARTNRIQDWRPLIDKIASSIRKIDQGYLHMITPSDHEIRKLSG